MGMSDIMHSKRWKTFMGYVYGFGAALVLLGALFKIQHWPGASYMLTIGMSTEVLIFVLSSFEPLMVHPDWSRVYPQLREDFIPSDDEMTSVGAGVHMGHGGSGGLLENFDVSKETIAKVEKSLQELGNTAQSFADISTATMATEVYIRNLNSASESMSAFAEMNNRASHTIDRSMTEMVDSYNQTSEKLTKSTEEIAESISKTSKELSTQINTSGQNMVSSYKEFAESITKDLDQISKNSSSYGSALEAANNNLSSLNSSYELQLNSAQKHADATDKLQADFSKMNEALSGSLEQAKRYQEQTKKLNENIEALNTVYGNMLGAMNLKS